MKTGNCFKFNADDGFAPFQGNIYNIPADYENFVFGLKEIKSLSSWNTEEFTVISNV